MKVLTKEWFNTLNLKIQEKELDNNSVTWLESLANVSINETQRVINTIGLKYEVNELFEREILQINFFNKELNVKLEGGEIFASCIDIVENELGIKLCEEMVVRAIELYRCFNNRFEIHFLIEKTKSQNLCYLTIASKTFKIKTYNLSYAGER